MRIIWILFFVSLNAFGLDKRILIIQNGVISNIAIWDGSSPWHPCAGIANCQTTEIPMDSRLNIGWTCDNADDPKTCHPEQDN